MVANCCDLTAECLVHALTLPWVQCHHTQSLHNTTASPEHAQGLSLLSLRLPNMNHFKTSYMPADVCFLHIYKSDYTHRF